MTRQVNVWSIRLSLERKKRVPPADLATTAQIQSFTTLSTHPIHKASEPGILCLDVHPTDDNKIVTGGADKTVVIFDRAQGKKLQTLSGHTKKLSAVAFHPTANVVFSASHDKTARIWNYGEGSRSSHLKVKTDLLIHVHPSFRFSISRS